MRLIRKLRFIFIALLTSLFVINAAFLRKTVALLLCSVLSFNLASYYSFLNQGEIANAATPQSRTPVTAGKNASPGSNPKYQFQLVAKAEMVVDGQALVDPGATANSPNKRTLIDDKGHIVYSDRGCIFLDHTAVAFKGKQIGNFVINEVGNYYLFKNGTLDILADVFDTQNKRNSTILIRDGKPLATFANSSSISPTMYPECTLNLNEPGCTANAYYLYAYYKNYFRFDADSDNYKEVSIEEAKRRLSSSPSIVKSKIKETTQCIRNDKNQIICSLTDPSGLLIRDDGKVFPSTCCDYQLNNNGKILTFNELKVFDYDKDAMPANTKFSKKDLEKAAESYGLKVPYDTLLGIPTNVDWKGLKHNTAKISDNGDIAIIVQAQVGNPYNINKNKTFFASAIIRATPSGSVTAKAEPKIYNIFIGGFFDHTAYKPVENYVKCGLDGEQSSDCKKYETVVGLLVGLTKDNHNIINSYNMFDDHSGILARLEKAIEEKKKTPNITINIIGHSYGADTGLTDLAELIREQPEKYKGMVNNLILADPVSTLKRSSTEIKNYRDARSGVMGKIIDIDADYHGTDPDPDFDIGDSAAYNGGRYGNVLKGEAGITYIEAQKARHGWFPSMMEDLYPELGGKSVEETFFTKH
jgi:hypothetical protein